MYASIALEVRAIVTESPAAAVKLYSLAKRPARWGAAQSAARNESLTRASSVIGVTVQGAIANWIGIRAGLPDAPAAETITVSRYTPGARPRGSSETISVPGVVLLVALSDT